MGRVHSINKVDREVNGAGEIGRLANGSEYMSDHSILKYTN